MTFLNISRPSDHKVPESEIPSRYRSLRSRTFWGATVAYSLFYVCRMTLNVVKQPLIDGGVLTAEQLGIIGSMMLLVYAVGKLVNGFFADHCNVRRFMAVGLGVSSVVNLVIGILGFILVRSGAVTDGTSVGLTASTFYLAVCALWFVNGWTQSMGAPPGVISLSRWFPLSKRGTYYSIFSASPYLGKFLSFICIGLVAGKFGWQSGFIFSAVVGLIGTILIVACVSDTPESKGLPSVQVLTGESPQKADSLSTNEIQRRVLRHPGIWVIALSSAFVYITQYGISNWGVLFLQRTKDFSLEGASSVMAFSESFGILGTIGAGWLSDKVFGGNRVKPVILSGLLCMASLAAFLFLGGGTVANIVYISLFSLSIGVLYCIVAGLMAVDIVPRKATGAAMGIVGFISYLAASLQDFLSGQFIGSAEASSQISGFMPVAIFWTVSCALAFILPALCWNKLKKDAI